MPQTKKQKAIVRRWVKNLESGLYKQGKGVLAESDKDFDRFCCLGVLCDMAVRAKVIPAPLPVGIGDAYEYVNQTGNLPRAVRDWAGMMDRSGDYDSGNLANLNDDGKKFKTIAKIIKSDPKGLFV